MKNRFKQLPKDRRPDRKKAAKTFGMRLPPPDVIDDWLERERREAPEQRPAIRLPLEKPSEGDQDPTPAIFPLIEPDKDDERPS